MSEQKAFSLKVDEQNIAWLAIDVPNEKMNTLQAAFADEMKEIFAQLKDSSGIKDDHPLPKTGQFCCGRRCSNARSMHHSK